MIKQVLKELTMVIEYFKATITGGTVGDAWRSVEVAGHAVFEFDLDPVDHH